MSMPQFERGTAGPILRESIVVYADLLGTRDHATGARAEGTLRALDKSLSKAKKESGIDSLHRIGFHASWFSDNLCLAAPLPTNREGQDHSLVSVLTVIAWLQFELAVDGFFMRGGVTLGPQFADDTLTFGPALVDAVKLEGTTSFPRVQLDRKVQALIHDQATDSGPTGPENPYCAYVMASGPVQFVSYLGAVLEVGDHDEGCRMFAQHRDALHEQLVQHSFEEKILEKYLWSSQYHDAFCRQYFPSEEDLEIGNAGQRLFTVLEPEAPRSPAGSRSDGK